MSDAENTRYYGLQDWVAAYRQPVSDTFVCRRSIATKLAAIGNSLIRADLPLDELQQIEAQIAALQRQLTDVPRHEHRGQFADMMAGRADQDRIMMGFDYDAVTGPSNPAAPRLSFRLDGTDVEARVTLGPLHEGGPGNAHGGVLAAMLDVVLARVQHAHGWIGVTGYLNLRYCHPTPLHKELTLKAWATSRIGRMTKVAGGVWVGEKQTVEADALFVVPKGI